MDGWIQQGLRGSITARAQEEVDALQIILLKMNTIREFSSMNDKSMIDYALKILQLAHQGKLSGLASEAWQTRRHGLTEKTE